MTDIEIIVAMGQDRAIGRRGDLAFHICEDLRRFKELTMGHPIVMGRKTFESLPKGALPGRRNIVVSRNPEYSAPGAEVFGSLREAIEACAGAPKVFIIGGGQIYRQALPDADVIHLTLVDADTPDADTFFPPLSAEWKVVDESPQAQTPEGIGYSFRTLRHC